MSRDEIAEVRRTEREHYVGCRMVGCARCALYAVRAARQQQRLVNLVFSTVWVVGGMWAMCWLACRVFGW
jgi:hypothetical protein